MTDRSVAIRLATDGKEQVKRDLTEIGDTGDAQARRWQKSYDQAGDMIAAAVAKQRQAAQKLAAITPATSTQQIYQAGASTNYTGSSARDSAVALKQLLDEQDRLAASAAALKARIDPLSVAQAKYDAEVKNATALYAANAISEAQRDAAIALSQKELTRATQALGSHSNALGFNRMQFMIAEGAAHRYVDSILAGMSPMRAFMMQAGDVGNILAMDDKGVAGGLAKVKALLTPTAIALGATAAVVAVGAAAWYSYSSAIDKLDGLAQGAGRLLGETGGQLEANAEAAASAGDITVGAARKIEASYVQIAKSGDVLTGLTAITKDFAAATGQDVTAATQQLAAAFADPIAGAREMAEKYGALTEAQVDYIAKLVEEGNQTEAQRQSLKDLEGAFDGAAAHASNLANAWHVIATGASEAWSWMGKALDMTVPYLLAGATGQSVWLGPQVNLKAEQDAKANAARAQAQEAADKYTGASGLDDIRKTAGTLQAGIAAGGTPEQLAQWTAALNANQHALTSWIPAQDKANQLAALDAKIAAAKTPAAKAALAAEREKVSLAGSVITTQDAENRATEAGNKVLAAATHHSGAHALSLARQAESMEVAAKASLDLADAYLESGAAGIEADAERKAATDATRKGIDIAAQAQRQLNLDVAQAVANGAKSVAQMRDETAARAAVNAQVSGGTLAASQMNQALSDEEVLRPLLTLRAVAHGQALEELNKVIAAQTAALKDRNATLATSDFNTAMDQSKRNVANLKAGITDLTLSPRDQAINAARRSAADYARAQNYNPKRTSDYVDQQGLEAAAGYAADIAKSFDQQYKSNQANLALAQAEASTFGMSADRRELILDHLQHEIDLQRQGYDLSSNWAKTLLAQDDAIDAANIKLRAMNDNWQELTGFGDQFLSDALDPQNWTSWGNVAKRELGDIESELIKLIALNPIKNWLFGENNPTISSVGGLLGSLLHHGAGATAAAAQAASTISSAGYILPFASGTQYFSGGSAYVGEHGPEIVDLPAGSRIHNASDTRRMLAAANDAGPSRVAVDISLNTDLFNAAVDARADGRVRAAAPRIAAGGAQIAQQRTARAAANRLGSAR